jgi:alkanesulfonate monooxygenase SsuD/methylene tetrahydromethanopterin reductase-like flavin-dependent oxidoreductase (luciferase family)
MRGGSFAGTEWKVRRMAAGAGVEFGWRVPDFPTDGISRGGVFPEQIERNLVAARGAGLTSAWVADHVVPWAEWQDAETDTIECWTALSFLAGAHRDLTWGTIVLCQSYRNPALLAKMVAQLCSLAPGRVVFGIGAGWKADEYRAYGYPFPAPAVRIAQLEDTVEIARRLWTTPGPVSYQGRHYAIEAARLQPKPNPLPPVMIGGGGEQLTLRVVAKHADWYNLPGGTLENYRHKLEVLARHCSAVGRDPATIRKTWACECVAVAGNHAEAERMAQGSPFYNPETALVGTPDEVAQSLGRWVEAGVSLFQLRFADFPRTDALELFGREVRPRFGG